MSRTTRPSLAVTSVAVLVAMALPAACTPERGEPVPAPAPTTSPAEEGTALPTPSPGPRTVRLALAGDVLMHDGLWAVARREAARAGRSGMDFAPILEPAAPPIEAADVAVCHLETPLAQRGGPYSNYPVFAVPPQTMRALAAVGFDACTTASNHSLDQGFTGLAHTLDVLDRHGIEHTGTARSAAESRKPLRIDVAGIDIALLAYTYGTNGIPLPDDRRWSVNLIDPDRIDADARRARRQGADAVVVALHWGEEYQHRPSAYQRSVADAVTRSPAVDLVYGHHAHVVQPVRRVNGTWVAYGLGNFVAQQETDRVGVYEGMVAEFDVVRRPSGEVQVRWAGYRPTYITRYQPQDPGMRVHDIRAALRDPSVPRHLRAEMRAARQRVRAVVGQPPNRRQPGLSR